MNYGLPYKGSKNKIAKQIVDAIPSAPVLVDVFAGGCSVTHAALLSGKWDRVVANDSTDMPRIFADAVAGEYRDWQPAPTREEFLATDDRCEKVCYSFANNGHNYDYGAKWEQVKSFASKMLSAPSLHERRMWYIKFIRVLAEYIEANGVLDVNVCKLSGVQSVERVQSLDAIGNTGALDRLQVVRGDYRTLCIPHDAVLYADPPYRAAQSGDDYFGQNVHHNVETGGFDVGAFDEWLMGLPCICVVSETERPDGCTCVAEIPVLWGSQAGKAHTRAVERLFVQDAFVDEYHERMGTGKMQPLGFGDEP